MPATPSHLHSDSTGGVMKRLALASLIFTASLVATQTKPPPVSAPPNTLLVTRTCAVAWVSGPKRAEHFLANGIRDVWGASQACNGSFNERELLVAGEYRLFMHLIGAHEEYDVSCLGHLKWDAGWSSSEHFYFDGCVVPRGKHGYWLDLGWGCKEGECATPALPKVGYYIPANWDGDNLVLNFGKDYHDSEGVNVSFVKLHSMKSSARVLSPNELQTRPACANGSVTVGDREYCRPE